MSRRESNRNRTRGSCALAVLALGFACAPAYAGTFTVTVPGDPAVADDSYLREDDADQENGDKPEVRLKATSGNKNRHILVRVPTGLSPNATVLQAWLRLYQYGANNELPIDAPVHPVTESWVEDEVSWEARRTDLFWTEPGATRLPYWTDRRAVSEATNGGFLDWQIGPALLASQNGELDLQGFVIEGDRNAPDRECVFRSLDYTNDPALRPKLILWYTDEPPALRRGWAEVQPQAVLEGTVDVPFSLWLDLDASGTTPSGAATGVDLVTLQHGGALVVTALDRFSVDGVPLNPAQLNWFDNGTAFTVQHPRIQSASRVQIEIRADVVATAQSFGISLPVFADDNATPSVWQQVLWPRDADGTPGNGDDWTIDVLANAVVNVDLVPDADTLVATLCTQLDLFADDAEGNRFPVNADSFLIDPPGLGTITPGGKFCGAQAGSGTVVAWFDGISDTTQMTVTPALTPVISAIELRDAGGALTAALSPRDTLFLDCTVSDGDGFQDVGGLDVSFALAGHETDRDAPAYRAAFQWRRGGAPSWTIADPVGTSWQILPGLCSIDTLTNSTAPEPVRLAFVTGTIARASASGEWTARVDAHSATPPDTSGAALTGLDALPLLEIAVADTAGRFSPGGPSATSLPLNVPTDGNLDLEIRTNAAYDLRAVVTDLVGTSSPTDTLRVGTPAQRIAWAFQSSGAGGGRLDTTVTVIAGAEPAPESEAAIERSLHLWIDHPASLPAQDYRGSLTLALAENGGAGASTPIVRPLTASLFGSGGAADSVAAEVLPNRVAVGTSAQSMTAYLLPDFQFGDTGIDRVLVNVPDDYGTPVVTSVRVGGGPVSFTDLSGAGLVEVVLASPVATPALLEVRFDLDTPTVVDSAGADFVVLYDDAGTGVPPQSASEDDANGLADGDDWRVFVDPGPVASLAVTPDTATVFVDSTIAFTASAEDAFGNPLSPALLWSTDGVVGTVNGSGVFTAVAPGTGFVAAEAGGFSDTARVEVLPNRGLAVRSVTGPDTTYQGARDAQFRIRVENLGSRTVRLDTLELSFTRLNPGDANGDYAARLEIGNPDTLAGTTSAWLIFRVDVDDQADLGVVTAGARAVGTEIESGLAVEDASADTTKAFSVVSGGIEVTGIQLGRPVLPGSAANLLFELHLDNRFPVARTLASVTFANRTLGAGDVDQLDAELGELTLYLDDGDGTLEPATDPILSRTVALSGVVNFAPLANTIPPGSRARLFLAADVPLSLREGDVLDLAVDAAADLEFVEPVFFRNAWPLAPPGSFPVDGMVAAQIGTPLSGSGTVLSGSKRNLAFVVELPANGYEADVLDRLAVSNLGSADDAADLESIEAWIDDGNGAFDPLVDPSLGVLARTGSRWERTGLSEAVPTAGIRIFFTVDVQDFATEGRTIHLALPGMPDPGAGMNSGNTGPIDAGVSSPFISTVSTADRLTLTARPLTPRTARPGERDVVLLELGASNTYATPRTLTEIAFSNATVGPGTLAERDAEIQVLELRADGNDDGTLDAPSVDPLLGVAVFDGGRATFSGLSWTVAAGGSRTLFLTAEVDLATSRDGDELKAVVADGLDVTFQEATTITASWPLDAGGTAAVDGLVADQILNSGAAGVSLAPGDGPALALDVRLPRNGYRDDVLNGFGVVNRGSAVAGDLAELRLWRDGGNGAFEGGGDDLDLGALTLSGGTWWSLVLGEAVGASGIRLFVSVTVSASPTDSATVELAVPVGGVIFASTNDGPIDREIRNPETLLIGTAPLLAELTTVPSATIVGQSHELRMIVRNVGSEDLLSVVPSAPSIAGTAGFVPTSGPTPASLDLAPAEVDTFVWRYDANAPGTSRFTAGAQGTGSISGTAWSALSTSSNLHRVFTSLDDLSLFTVQTMPVDVAVGQTGVVPFSLTLVNEGGAGAPDGLLHSMRIRLEDAAGAGIVSSDLLTRALVNEGTNVYVDKTVLESSGAEVALAFVSPVRITSQEPVTLSLRLDVSATTTVSEFRVVVSDSSYFASDDAATGAPLHVTVQDGSFPIRSGLARIVAPPSRLDVTTAALAPRRVGREAADVGLATFRLGNPGPDGTTTEIRVDSVSFVFRGAATIADPSTRLSRVRARGPTQDLASRTLLAGADSLVVLALSPPLQVSVNNPVDLEIRGDVAGNAPLGDFRLRIHSGAGFRARDAKSRDTVGVFYDAWPADGGLVTVEAEAESLVLDATPRMPAAVLVGQTEVEALRIRAVHPGVAGTARIRVDTLFVQLWNQSRTPLVPSTFLDRLALRWNGVEAAEITSMPSAPGAFPVPFAAPLLEPGDTTTIEIVLDVDASAPVSFLEISVSGSGVRAVDSNTDRPVEPVAAAGFELPLLSGLAQLESPARELLVGFESRLPVALAADGREVTLGTLQLRNPAPPGAGTILVDRLELRAAGRDTSTVSFGTIASRVRAEVGGVSWVESAALDADSLRATLRADSTLAVDAGETVTVQLVLVPQGQPLSFPFRLGCDEDGVGVVQPSGALLSVSVRPETGSSFPFWTEVSSFSTAGLEESYSNYPNPFAAGREPTTFVYFLPSNGRVSLRIWTPWGDAVARLLDGEPRGAGLHQSDLWDGRNAVGRVVRNGVYVAELVVELDDGSTRRLVRKVAIAR